MKKDKSKSVKCVRDFRDFPPSSYKLPQDGRRWKNVCVQRRALAMQLSTHADGDGTRIYVGLPRIAAALEISPRTLDRRLAELKELGILSNHGLMQEHGTAIRWLDPSKLKMPASPNTPAGSPDTVSGSPDRTTSGSPDTKAGSPDTQAASPDSEAGSPKPADFGEQPSGLTDQPTDQPTDRGWLDPWLKNQETTMGAPTKQQKVQLTALAGREGESRTTQAFELFKRRRKGLIGLDYPWAIFLMEAEQWLKEIYDEAAEQRAR